MAFYSVLVFFVVSHLLVLHSADSCPSSIECGHREPLKFPFTNATQQLCGLCTVRCDDPVPRVMLGLDGKLFQISGFTNDTIKIEGPELKPLIDSKKCDLFSYFDRLNTPSISFTITPSITLFKCHTRNREDKLETDKYFSGFYGNDTYKGCLGYTVYHTDLNQQVLVPTTSSNHPSNCVAYHLPMLPSVEGRDPSDAFSLLASNFSIGFHVSKECNKCHADGGQCSRDTREFKCLDERGGRSYNLALILGTAAAIAIGIFVIVYFCIIRKLARSDSIGFWKHKTESHRKIEAFLKNCGSLSPKRYTYSDVKKMTNSFRIKLGQGGYGCVFEGKLENGSFVAVKVLKGLKGNGEEFINEVVTISRTSHVNIVTLLGFCFDGCHRALIDEFMPNGSLDKFIHDGGSSTYWHLDWEALYRIVVGIARGLEYLHRGCNTQILHFDIKPHNILLTEDFCPKISDFGLAKLCPQKESIISLMGARGTVGYIAPEVFNRNFGGVSHKSDVYSYGMMIIEMVGGRKNTSVEVDHTSEIYFPHWIYKRLELDEELGLHGITNDETSDNLRKMNIVGLWCIQTDPCHRPSMSRVLEMLEGSTESLQIPPKPFLASPLRPPTDSSTTLVSQHCDNT